MSKANEVDAYRFNPNGTPEEILANNPGVFRGADGKYYIPNKWSPNEPYLIDPSKEQMIMMYGGDDMAVCNGAIFKGSYVDNLESMSYQDPSKLAYGEVGRFTKQAPGAFKVMPEGTKIQTLEGVRTVGEGEVVALDHAGNPYATTPANILKRNIGFSDEAMNTMFEVDAAATYKNNPAWMQQHRPYEFEIAEAQSRFSNPEIKAAISQAADEIRGRQFIDPRAAMHPTHHNVEYYGGTHSATAKSIKAHVLNNKGINIGVEYDDYYGRTIVGAYYTYQNQKFNIPIESTGYEEAIDALISRVFEGNIPLDKSIF